MNIIEKPSVDNTVDDINGVVHLRGPDPYLTMCGLCDVPTIETDKRATCAMCFSALDFVRKEHQWVRIPKEKP